MNISYFFPTYSMCNYGLIDILTKYCMNSFLVLLSMNQNPLLHLLSVNCIKWWCEGSNLNMRESIFFLKHFLSLMCLKTRTGYSSFNYVLWVVWLLIAICEIHIFSFSCSQFTTKPVKKRKNGLGTTKWWTFQNEWIWRIVPLKKIYQFSIISNYISQNYYDRQILSL